jgi:hypothetical protein
MLKKSRKFNFFAGKYRSINLNKKTEGIGDEFEKCIM